jgi:hypothetical protein
MLGLSEFDDVEAGVRIFVDSTSNQNADFRNLHSGWSQPGKQLRDMKTQTEELPSFHHAA